MIFGEREIIQPTDTVTPCPLCTSDKPCTSVRLLRNVVKRGPKYTAVISGELMRCEECQGEWAYSYLGGVFSKRPRQTAQVPPSATSTQDFTTRKKTDVTAWTPLQRQAKV